MNHAEAAEIHRHGCAFLLSLRLALQLHQVKRGLCRARLFGARLMILVVTKGTFAAGIHHGCCAGNNILCQRLHNKRFAKPNGGSKVFFLKEDCLFTHKRTHKPHNKKERKLAVAERLGRRKVQSI